MDKCFICLFCLALFAMVTVPASTHAQVPPSNEDKLMWSLANGILDRPKPANLVSAYEPAPAVEITRSQTYRLTKLDNRLTGKAIAFELAKASILDELMVHIKARANRSGGFPELLPACEGLEVLLPSIISIKQTGEEWANGAIKLTAKTTYVLDRIVPAIAESCSNPDTLHEIRSEHSMGNDALNEIMQVQKEAIQSVEESILNQRYLDAVSQLVTANQLQRGRYLALRQDIQQAIDTYTLAIANSPRLSAAYRYRGALYIYIQNLPNALKDIAMAAQLGDKRAQNYLSSKGIEWHIN